MKRKMNVLSVDFDYFQKVDKDTLACYPDGLDLGTEISKFVWAGHYANPKESDKLLSVEVDIDKINHMKKIISDTYDINTQVMICNSHKRLYELINIMYDQDEYDGVDIYNVDMHHDLFNDNSNLDCGNWVSHVMNEIPNSSVMWVTNPISKDAYGMDKERFYMVSEDLSDVEYINYDIIFLCRSDIWTPPHLDSYFKDLAEYILKDVMWDYKSSAFIEDTVLEERDCTKQISELRRVYSKFNVQVMR